MDGVLWDDGRVEGNPELKATERALTVGHAQQLRGVLAILRTAAPASDSTAEPTSLGQIRAAIEALPIRADSADATLAAEGVSGHVYSVEIGRQQVKDAVLQDIDAYVQAHPGSTRSPAPWALEARPKYSAWLNRTGSLVVTPQ